MTNPATPLEAEMIDRWGNELASSRATILHRQHGVVGRVKAYYDGETNIRRDGAGVPFRGRAIELDDGNCFVANPTLFVRLNPRENLFWEKAKQAHLWLLGELAMFAKSEGIGNEMFTTVILTIMRCVQPPPVQSSPTSAGTPDVTPG